MSIHALMWLPPGRCRSKRFLLRSSGGAAAVSASVPEHDSEERDEMSVHSKRESLVDRAYQQM